MAHRVELVVARNDFRQPRTCFSEDSEVAHKRKQPMAFEQAFYQR